MSCSEQEAQGRPGGQVDERLTPWQTGGCKRSMKGGRHERCRAGATASFHCELEACHA